MKKNNIFTLLGLGFGIFSISSSILIHHHIIKELQVGDYVEKLDSYVANKIEDEIGHVKAIKNITPSDNKYNEQKKYSHTSSMIGDIESVWNSYTGKGTTIAIIDDGFKVDHPEYTRKDGTHAILDASRSYFVSGNYVLFKSYSSDKSCLNEDWEIDSKGNGAYATHGTNTSTTAAAPMNNGGIVGIAPEADILALKIDFSFAAIEEAIRYAVDQKVDVINMSLGAFAESFYDGFGDYQDWDSYVASYLEDACKYAYDNDVIVVASAGNEATYHRSYPACNYKVIGVGALEEPDYGGPGTLAAFTNYNYKGESGEQNVDILSPGYVYVAGQGGNQGSPSNTYHETQGTSFSSPIVAGAAALWKQKYPNGTPDEFLEKLQSTADGIGTYKNEMIPTSYYEGCSDQGPSNISNGRLNVYNLLDGDDPYVTIKQESVIISIGETKQIDLDTCNGDISYQISDTKIASISNTGLLEGISIGSTTLKVIATKNNKTASVTIPVTVQGKVACESISINPSTIDLSIGGTYEIEPTISTIPNNATRTFMYESSDEDIATVDFETGIVTAKSIGTTNILVMPESGSCEATLTVNVIDKPVVQGYNKITSTSELTDGEYLIVSESYNVVFNGALSTLDATGNVISTTINNGNISSSIEIDNATFTISKSGSNYSIKSSSGNYIGNSSDSNALTSSSTSLDNTISFESNGDVNITGSKGSVLRYNKETNNGNRFRYYKTSSYLNQQPIQLYKASSNSGSTTPEEPTDIPVTGVSLNKTSLSLNIGDTSTLVASITPNDATNKDVTWTSNNNSIASVNDNGVVTANGVGTATITVTTVDGNKTATCLVTVIQDNIPVTGVTLNNSALDLYVGDNSTLVATVSPSNATNKAVTWSSSNEDVATISDNGVISAISEGTATITVTTVDQNKTATCLVTVNKAVTPTPSSLDITFKTGSGDGTEMTTSTSESSYLSSGGEYISSISSVSKTYSAGSNGLKLGTSSNAGNITFKLADTYTVTSIVVTAKLYRSDKSATLNVNSKGSKTLTSSFTEYTYAINENINTLTLTSSKYVWISKVSIKTEDTSDKVISSLTASYLGGDIYQNSSLDSSKVSVNANYTDSNKYPSEPLSSNEYTLTGFSSVNLGISTVTVTYTGSASTSISPLTTTFTVNIIKDDISDITVSSSKSYFVGEAITKNDLTVKATYLSGKTNLINDYDFEEYMFTYNDALSGGSLTNKELSISYNGNTYNFNVSVCRKAYETPKTETKNIDGKSAATAGVPSSSGSAITLTNKTINGINISTSSNVYIFTKNDVQYFSFGKNAGSIYNTSSLENPISSISVETANNSRSDHKIYVSKNGTNWVLTSNADLNSESYTYFKVEYASSSSSYSNFNISLILKGKDTALTLSNYLMFEDTNNQCIAKLDKAIDMFNSLTKEDRKTFMTSEDYVIKTARNRLNAWLINQGKTITENNQDYIINKNNPNTSILNRIYNNTDSSIAIIVTSISLLTISMLICYFSNKHKKEK